MHPCGTASMQAGNIYIYIYIYAFCRVDLSPPQCTLLAAQHWAYGPPRSTGCNLHNASVDTVARCTTRVPAKQRIICIRAVTQIYIYIYMCVCVCVCGGGGGKGCAFCRVDRPLPQCILRTAGSTRHIFERSAALDAICTTRPSMRFPAARSVGSQNNG